MLRGGCLCGGVRYEIEGDPVVVAHCHCTDCQRLSGAGHTTGAMFPVGAVTVHGAVSEFQIASSSDSVVTRSFCPTCGSPLFGRNTGMAGFKAYFSALGGEQPIPEKLDGLVAIQADGDYVTLSFSREYVDPALKDETYTTTWFDMFRIVDGKIVEHWDSATKGPGPTRAPAKN